jgi:hypothetical protein
MIKKLKQWWRPHNYHVEFFRGPIGMASWHDEKSFDNLEDAKARLEELSQMTVADVMCELKVNFAPSFMRILCGISPRPYRRALNYFKVPLIRFKVFGFQVWI